MRLTFTNMRGFLSLICIFCAARKTEAQFDSNDVMSHDEPELVVRGPDADGKCWSLRKGDNDVDVVFLLDTSGDFRTDKFDKMLALIEKAVNWMSKLPPSYRVRVAILEFGKSARVDLDLADRSNKVLKKSIKHLRGKISKTWPLKWDRTWSDKFDEFWHETNTPAGLEQARKVFSSSRRNSRKYTIVITNGPCNLINGIDCDRVRDKAEQLRGNADKEFVFGIGIGKANPAELEKITGTAKFVKRIDNYDLSEMKKIEEFLEKKLVENIWEETECRQAEEEPCTGDCVTRPCCINCKIQITCHCGNPDFSITVAVNDSLTGYLADWGSEVGTDKVCTYADLPSNQLCCDDQIQGWGVNQGNKPFTHSKILRAEQCNTSLTVQGQTPPYIIYGNTLKLMETDGVVIKDEMIFDVECNCTVEGDVSGKYTVIEKRKDEKEEGETPMKLVVGCGPLECCKEDEKDVKECCLKERVFVQAEWDKMDLPNLPNEVELEIFASNCWATPDSNSGSPPRVELIEEGCGVKKYDFIKEDSGRFSFEAFRFPLHKEVFIHCELLVCQKGDPTSRCNAIRNTQTQNGCPDVRRMRRSLPSGSVVTTRQVMVGPLTINDAPLAVPVRSVATRPRSRRLGALKSRLDQMMRYMRRFRSRG